MTDWYWYEETAGGEIRLLRVFGTSPEVVVPEKIAGKRVTELGAYCFAAKSRVKNYQTASGKLTGDEAAGQWELYFSQNRIRELSGAYVQKITLPPSVKVIGSFCFYQCSELREIRVGQLLTEIGSDAFMNCLHLHQITVCGSVWEASGLKQILGQRSLETEAFFCKDGRTEAVLIYPEYTETYDEIGPAHIFELNIEGEGFRARQCFHEGIVDLAQYDSVFSQASVMESEKTLCRMAWMRLYYPEGLKEEYKYIYEEYLKKHAKKAGELLVKERNLPLLEYAGEHAYFNEQQIKECIQTAVRENWTEGVCRLLQCQKQWFTNKEKDEYSFEDF